MFLLTIVYKAESSKKLDENIGKQLVHNTSVREQDHNRNNIDIRYATINNGVYMFDPDNHQTNTPNRASSFFYNYNDLSGNSIIGIAYSNRPSLVSIMINNPLVKGYCIGQISPGIHHE